MRHKWSKPVKRDVFTERTCKVCGCVKSVSYDYIRYTRNDILFTHSPTCVDDNEEYKGRID